MRRFTLTFLCVYTLEMLLHILRNSGVFRCFFAGHGNAPLIVRNSWGKKLIKVPGNGIDNFCFKRRFHLET